MLRSSSLLPCLVAGLLLAWPAAAQPGVPVFDSAYARHHHLKTVRVLQGSADDPEVLRVEETYRFAASGRLLSYRNPGLEATRETTRGGHDYRDDEEQDALGRVVVTRHYIDDELESTTYSTYDERGQAVRQVIREFTIYPGTEFQPNGGFYDLRYAYDGHGHQVETVSGPTFLEGVLDLGTRQLFAYDAQHRGIAYTEYKQLFLPVVLDSTYYNAAGLVTRQAKYNWAQMERPVLTSLQLESYDAHNRPVSSINLDQEGSHWQQLRTIRYRPDGQLLEELEYTATFRRAATVAEALRRTADTLRTAPDCHLQRTAYRYNARGQLVEWSRARADGRGHGLGPHFGPVISLTRWRYDYYR